MNLLKKLLGRGCKHKFSWPRIGADGRHYQICIGCGTAYEYDWNRMRRTDHLMVPVAHPNDHLLVPGVHHA